tara:strand:- start:440 stop:637 length:198 start_codon:yes stop_codon:yes gene_type:complete
MIRSGDIKKLAKKYNMELVKRKGKHIKWIHRVTRVIVHTACTPSDCNAIKNIERDFKEAAMSIAA